MPSWGPRPVGHFARPGLTGSPRSRQAHGSTQRLPETVPCLGERAWRTGGNPRDHAGPASHPRAASSETPPMPNPKFTLLGGTFLLAAVLAGVAHTSSQAQEPQPRAKFMRQKLEYSQKILEGLALEDYNLLAREAKALKLMSQAAEWEVPTIPNVEQYLPLTTDFQRLCDELSAKARDKNLDGATLVFTQLTVNCVKCHKYVRDGSK